MQKVRFEEEQKEKIKREKNPIAYKFRNEFKRLKDMKAAVNKISKQNL